MSKLISIDTVKTPPVPLDTLGERVAYLLSLRGMNYNKLDQAIEQTSGYTTRLITGEKRHPRPDILLRIARVFDVRMEWLYAGHPPMRDVLRPDASYPSRARVVAAARLLDWMWTEEVVSHVEQVTLPSGTPDPGAPFWWTQLHDARDRLAILVDDNARRARLLRDTADVLKDPRVWPSSAFPHDRRGSSTPKKTAR